MERRAFLSGGAGAVLGANDRIRVAQIGLGARGHYELTLCMKIPGVEVAAVCDPFRPLVDHAVRKLGGHARGFSDFRRVLELKDIDAVFVSTPDHWHAPISILACMAGKDVYCEKPLTHTIEEGRRMVEAARKHRRVVMTGSQQRSAPHFQKVRDLIQGGYIGEVSFVECWNINNAFPEGCGNPPDEDPPPGLDWDMYLGPAPKVPYNRNRFIWHYRWFWDYSGGMMTDWGAHHMDSLHHIMGVDAPLAVSSTGGKFQLRDNRQTPDFFRAVFRYPNFVASYTNNLLNASRLANRTTGMLFHGTKGTLVIDRMGYEVMPEVRRMPAGEPPDMVAAMLASRRGPGARYELGAPAAPAAAPAKAQPLCEPIKVTGISLDPEIQIVHIKNWLECIRSRARTVADWEIGHRAVTACHLGVIAQRTGRTIRWDAKTEQILDDPQAARMMRKEYRAPWSLPA